MAGDKKVNRMNYLGHQTNFARLFRRVVYGNIPFEIYSERNNSERSVEEKGRAASLGSSLARGAQPTQECGTRALLLRCRCGTITGNGLVRPFSGPMTVAHGSLRWLHAYTARSSDQILMRGITAVQISAGAVQPTESQKRRFAHLLVEYSVCGAELEWSSDEMVLEQSERSREPRHAEREIENDGDEGKDSKVDQWTS